MMSTNIRDLIPEELRSFRVTMIDSSVNSYSVIAFANNEDEIKSHYKEEGMDLIYSYIDVTEINREEIIFVLPNHVTKIWVKVGANFFKVGKRYDVWRYTISGIGIDDPYEIDASLVGNEWFVEVNVDPVAILLGGYSCMPDYLNGMKKGIERSLRNSSRGQTVVRIHLSSQDDYMKAMLCM